MKVNWRLMIVTALVLAGAAAAYDFTVSDITVTVPDDYAAARGLTTVGGGGNAGHIIGPDGQGSTLNVDGQALVGDLLTNDVAAYRRGQRNKLTMLAMQISMRGSDDEVAAAIDALTPYDPGPITLTTATTTTTST